jgi:hypothetical protein
MESRLIFLHQNHCDGVTEKARSAAIPPFKVVGVSSRQIRKRAIPEIRVPGDFGLRSD